MTALRRLLEGLGMADVATYLQSGNVVFTTDQTDREAVSRLLYKAIGAEFGFEIPVIVRDEVEMAAVVEACPYRAQADADPTRVHVTFVEPMPAGKTWSGLDPARYAPESHTLGVGVIYMLLPSGIGRAKLPIALARLTKDVVATTRNWRTVVNLAGMLGN
jgi:uncharacterized protein (DUF1697 family)